MRNGILLSTLFLLCQMPPLLPAQEATDPAKSEKTSSYETRQIQGWTVRISRKLLQDAEAAPFAEKTLTLLDGQLAEIVRIVPPTAVSALRKVTLWLSPEYPGVGPRAEYHPGADWLRENGRNPDMVKGVEISNPHTFDAELKRMPMLMLHELAHAYHDQVLGFDQPEIRKAWEEAVASGKYKSVERSFGRTDRPNTFESAYAITNEHEYFAEGTEAWFGRNDFFPFTSDQLKTHDPTLFVLLGKLWHSPSDGPCKIQITDKENGWPVPLVELRTVHGLRFVSDNAGLIAFDAPELMGQDTWLEVMGHGYEVGKDGFGMRGVRITPQYGGSEKVEVTRTNIALRMGRITGGGLFAESQQLGMESGWAESGVLGCDSLQLTPHGGRLFWMWGDTLFANYPLGVFDMTGGTTGPHPLQSLEPPLKLLVNYFRDEKGKARGMARMPGSGPTWASGLVSIPDKSGKDRLVCSYSKIKPPLDGYETGLAVWNEADSKFDQLKTIWSKSNGQPAPPLPEGHVVKWKDSDGKGWLLFGDPFPVLRCPDNFESWSEPATWEKIDAAKTVKSADDGTPVKVHRGGMAWNDWRKKWVTVFTEEGGKPSYLGEIWYTESDVPTGPWGPAVKILTHQEYTFYNPILHPEFTPDGSPWLFFEGTYTSTFSGSKISTPRYEYNQILYRLDLSSPALTKAQGR